MKRFAIFFLALLSTVALGADRVIINPDVDGDLKLKVNDDGVVTDVLNIQGSTSNVGIGSATPATKLDVNGVTSTNGGSAGAPGFSFRGGLATGIYSSGTDTLNVTTGGTERLRVDSAGNIGIGSATPATKLDVNGVTSTNGGSAGAPGYSFRGGLATGIYSSGTDTLNVTTGGTERLRVDSAGNIGIGTTTPSAALHIAGTSAGKSNATIGGGGLNSELSLQRAQTSIISPSLVANNTSVGSLSFKGYDGAAYIPIASIQGVTDGVTSTNDMPGRLSFSVTADGAATTTERLRIANSGVFTLNTDMKILPFFLNAPDGSVVHGGKSGFIHIAINTDQNACMWNCALNAAETAGTCVLMSEIVASTCSATYNAALRLGCGYASGLIRCTNNLGSAKNFGIFASSSPQ